MEERSAKELKNEYRKQAREKLAALTEEYRNGASAAIALNALNIPEMKESKRAGFLGLGKTEKTVLAYFSVGSEPSTLAVISELLKSGKRVCLPLCIDLDGNSIIWHRLGQMSSVVNHDGRISLTTHLWLLPTNHYRLETFLLPLLVPVAILSLVDIVGNRNAFEGEIGDSCP